MPLPVHPIAMIEAEALAIPAEAEGESGLDVRRLYLGARWEPAPWLTVVGSANPVAGEHDPLVVDAYVRLRPARVLEVTVGYGKTPLFSSAHDRAVETLPLPELSLSTRALWPGRDAGVELHLTDLPVEAWLRVGNGSGSPLGNDNVALALDTRVDLALGRARHGADPLGLRVGAGLHIEDAGDRAGITGQTPTGFVFWRSPAISGLSWTAEVHGVGSAGPVQLTLEGGAAAEGRAADTDGNPDTPRVTLDAVRALGGSAELAWMVTGQRRGADGWPVSGAHLGVEVAGRAARLGLGAGAVDVDPGGATGGELAVRVWHPLGLGAGVHGGVLRYDTAPLEEPEVTLSWFVGARVTARLVEG